ncbi:hypothetical protein ACC687_40460, partial [Rhizobium ruizarguesonis]
MIIDRLGIFAGAALAMPLFPCRRPCSVGVRFERRPPAQSSFVERIIAPYYRPPKQGITMVGMICRRAIISLHGRR